MDSNNNSYLSSDEASSKRPAKKRKRSKTYTQQYISTWELDPQFKPWLAKSFKGRNYYRCKLCDEDYTIVGGKSNLKKHQRSEKHSLKAKAVQFKKMIEDSFRQTDHLTQRIKEAEVRLAVFTAEHNIPFNVMNHLVQLIQKIGVDAEVVKKMTCSRTKCSQLVKNVTGATGFQNVVQFLRESKCSITVDESTDISSTKHLVLLARYFNGKSVTDEFLGLIPVADVKAVSLYNCIIEFFVKNEIPYKSNLIGFSSDGASNMFGVNHSLAVLLTKDVPNIFTMKCICHSFALCANYAKAILPYSLE